MKLIAHRGNTNGVFESHENEPTYIQMALDRGFDVEIDIWHKDGIWYLGHDKPQYGGFPEKYLEDERFWCHAKNIDALEMMLKNPKIHCFWHQNDDATITSKGYIWTYPGKQLTLKSVCMHPEQSGYDMLYYPNCYGICGDYIANF